MSKHPYRVLSVRSAPLVHTTDLLWTITVRQESAPAASALTLQVESARQPYAHGALVELCPEWIMPPDPA